MSERLKNKIRIVEVGPRDGLQNEAKILSLEVKLEFIKKLIDSGVSEIEVTSFVKSSSIPQMGDASELFRKLKELYPERLDSFICLVPNIKGLENALKEGVRTIALFTATSNEFNRKNINCTVEESYVKLKEVALLAQQSKLKLRGYISTAFGCPYEGEIPVEKLVDGVKKFVDLGVEDISIGDTIGVATPIKVERAIKELKKVISLDKLAMHFHDTRGMALANSVTSFQMGITCFDSSAGGLGGCPYAKGATGNVATEDLNYLFKSFDCETGIDMKKLVSASTYILDQIGKETPSKFLKAYLKTGY